MNQVYIKIKDIDSWIINRDYFKNKDIISINELISIIEDLDDEVEKLEEKLDETKKYYEDNYIPVLLSDRAD